MDTLRHTKWPLNINFPLYRRPRLRVIARGRGIPDLSRNPTLTIEVSNTGRAPVEITGVQATFLYGNLLAEAAFGGRTTKLPLHVLAGELQPPCTLGMGESISWDASLYQLREQLEERVLTPRGKPRYLTAAARQATIERCNRRGRLAIASRNGIAMLRAMLSKRRLAVGVRDGQGTLYKAKVRWEPPGGSSLGS